MGTYSEIRMKLYEVYSLIYILYKSIDKSNIHKYRPISLLSVLPQFKRSVPRGNFNIVLKMIKCYHPVCMDKQTFLRRSFFN